MKNRLSLILIAFCCCAAAHEVEKPMDMNEKQVTAISGVPEGIYHNAPPEMLWQRSYNRHKEQEYTLSLAGARAQSAAEIPVQHGWFSGKDWNILELRADKIFELRSGRSWPTPVDDIETHETVYSGRWQTQADTLVMELRRVAMSGIIASPAHPDGVEINRTTRFVFRTEDGALHLLPVFDRREAYDEMMSETACGSYSEYALLPILAGSQSALTAHTVAEMRKRTGSPSATLVKEQSDFVQNIIRQWYEGAAGLPVESPSPSVPLKEREVCRRWYGDDKAADIIYIQHPATMTAATAGELILSRKPVPVAEGVKNWLRLIFDLRVDGRFTLQLTQHSAPAPAPEDIVTQYRGSWTLDGDALRLHTTEFYCSAYGALPEIFHTAELEGSVRIGLTRSGELSVNALPLFEQTYRAFITLVERARAGEPFSFYGLTDRLADKYSALSAYDFARAQTLIAQISDPQWREDRPAFESACDELQAIVDRWYAAVR